MRRFISPFGLFEFSGVAVEAVRIDVFFSFPFNVDNRISHSVFILCDLQHMNGKLFQFQLKIFHLHVVILEFSNHKICKKLSLVHIQIILLV